MGQNNNKNKKKLVKKLFIKLARFLGYEIIDQNNFTVPTKNKFIGENLNEAGKSSITIPLGKTDITRKIKDLTIIIRCYTPDNNKEKSALLDQSKKRIFEYPKSEYTLRTINSVINSCNEALKFFTNLNINLIITNHDSNEEILNKINACAKKAKFSLSILSLKDDKLAQEINKRDERGNPNSRDMIQSMLNIYKSLEITKDQAKDMVYFLEDDYIHENEAISEMLYTYEKIASLLNDEIFLCPADYPYLYSKLDYAKIFIGSKRHWRTVNQTLITFMTSKKMILKHWNELKSLCTTRHHPFEKPLYSIFKKEYCLSPIPSLAMHCTNINSVFGLPPNFKWKEIWEENSIIK